MGKMAKLLNYLYERAKYHCFVLCNLLTSSQCHYDMALIIECDKIGFLLLFLLTKICKPALLVRKCQCHWIIGL